MSGFHFRVNLTIEPSRRRIHLRIMLLATRSRSALRSSLRYIHTTARTCDETNPSQSQPSRLGFGDYTGRTRVLPAIPISPSSKRNVLKSRFPGSSPALNQQTSPRTRGEGRRPQEKQRRQARSPVQASIRQLEAQEQSSVEGEEEFFVGNDDKAASRSKGAGLKSVDMDFAAPSPVKSSSARGRRATSSKERTVREKRPRAPRPVEPEVEDRSPEGIFGRASLLFPVRRGAREAERSVWAENLQPAEGTYLPVPSVRNH